MKPSKGLTKGQPWNVAQKMAKCVKSRPTEEFQDWLLAAKQQRQPQGVWPFELRSWHLVAQAPKLSISFVLNKTGQMDMWTKLEYQTALSLAQKLRPATMFYESLRLERAALNKACAVTMTQGKMFSEDGVVPFQNILDALSSTELKQTKLILDSSLGFVLRPDGSNKGKWHTKGELLLFRDVDEKGEVPERVLSIIFVTKDDLLEFGKLQQKPFGHEATCGRIRDLLQIGFYTTQVSAKNFLPHCMQILLQLL